MTLFSTQLNIIHMALITSGDGPSSPNAPEFCLQTPQMAAETSGKKDGKKGRSVIWFPNVQAASGARRISVSQELKWWGPISEAAGRALSFAEPFTSVTDR